MSNQSSKPVPSVAAVVPAGGSGSRMAAPQPKQFLELNGKPILIHTLQTLQACPNIKTITLVVPAPFVDRSRRLIDHFELDRVDRVISGGARRQDSVLAGIEATAPSPDFILVHDGVRPLVPTGLVKDCLDMAFEKGAAMAAVPVKDTLKSVAGGQVKHTVNRQGLWQAQTPQAAERELLLRAFSAAAQSGFCGTDEASLLERIGIPVQVVCGSEQNIKITRPEDLRLAEALLKERERFMSGLRIGQGYDVHQLVEDRKLILGGVPIPHHLGLKGHSDADVLLHAIADALLGAAALGDIGRHFPDSDPAYRDASSLALLTAVMVQLSENDFKVVNIDATVIAESPRLSPFLPEMAERIGATCSIPASSVNLKATTTEGLGFTGRREGIAAQAVVLLKR